MTNQEFTQKYTIVCFLQEIEEDFEFDSSDWPLHITLVDVFAIDWEKTMLIENFVKIAKNLKQISTKALNNEFFGPENNIPVTLLEKNEGLISIHYQLIKGLKKGRLSLNDPHFSGQGFIPHASVKKHGQIKAGEIIQIYNLALIDMFPKKDPYNRKILKIIKLNKY